MRRPERETTPEILKWLNDNGTVAWRMNSGAAKKGSHWIRMAPEGTPDIMGILPGRYEGDPNKGKAIFVENKSNGKPLTAEQTAWIIKAQRQGAHVIVALKGLEDVVSYYETVIGRGK